MTVIMTFLSANTIMAKLTWTRSTDQIYNIIDWQALFTWLWRWPPLRLSKRQSPTTVPFRTTLTRTITLYELLILLGSNHLLNDNPVANNISSKSYCFSHAVIKSHTCNKTVSFAMAGGAATVLACSATINAEKKLPQALASENCQ